MGRVRVVSDLAECRHLWESYFSDDCLFDLWDVRQCFADHYQRVTEFYVCEEAGEVRGILPLSWIAEENCYGFFPGETWNGKTWLERNRIYGSEPDVLHELLSSVPGDVRLSYMDSDTGTTGFASVGCIYYPDETGYRFYPEHYRWSYSNYLESIPGKSRKKLMKDIREISSKGVTFRYDSLEDTEMMFRMNIDAYGQSSYFADTRFLKSVQSLIRWLYDNKMLRIVTVLVNNDVAAVDIGAIWKNHCTMIAGGTHSGYRGVAKLINFHHIQWACRKRIESVDFLCGDFGWKERFRLSPEPLYKIIINHHVAAA